MFQVATNCSGLALVCRKRWIYPKFRFSRQVSWSHLYDVRNEVFRSVQFLLHNARCYDISRVSNTVIQKHQFRRQCFFTVMIICVTETNFHEMLQKFRKFTPLNFFKLLDIGKEISEIRETLLKFSIGCVVRSMHGKNNGGESIFERNNFLRT